MDWLTWDWLFDTPRDLLTMLFVAVGTYIALIVMSRLSGLRAYSKMASFDFAITVATGSIVASVVLSGDVPLVRGAASIVFLFGLQYLIAFTRSRVNFFKHLIDNKPKLLMVGDHLLEKNLREVRVTAGEVKSKLRQANVTRYEQVIAVVMETTGDIAVLTGDRDPAKIDFDLFDDIRDGHLVREAFAKR